MDASIIDTTIQTLLNNNLIENRLVNKDDSFFIRHTSSDFHEFSCKEETNNLKTLAQAMQKSALMNYIYIGNDVFNVFYVDYIELKKIMWMILLTLFRMREGGACGAIAPILFQFFPFNFYKRRN